MYNSEEIKEFFGQNLTKREVPLNLKKSFNQVDLHILEEIGLPNSDDLSLCFDNNICQIGGEIIIGKRVDLDICFNLKSKEVYQKLIGINKFIAPSLSSMLKLLYVIETFNNLRGKEELGNFDKNRKKYSDYLRAKLLLIDNRPELIDDYANGSCAGYCAAFLETLEFGGI
jgi:hypothetical protein